MASLGNLMAKLGLDLSEFNSSMAGVPAKFQSAADAAEKSWKPLETLGSSLMGIGTTLSAAITLPLVGVGAAAVKLSEQLNMARLSFTTMLGSAEKAGSFLKDLQKFAASTPFEFPQLVDAAKRMMAMGFAAEQVLPTLRTIGDTVAALGGNQQMIDRVTLALGQMQAKGKVSAQEMNQLAENGIPAWKMLADQIGVSIPEAMKLAEKGAISASVAVPAILDGMNQKFGGQMQQASQTLTGVWSNFKDTLSMTLADIGTTLTPALKSLVEAAMPLLQWAKDAAQWFAGLPAPVQNAALAFAAIAAAIGPILLAAGGMATGLAAITTAIGPLAGVLGVTTTAFLGWAAAIPLAVTALVALGTWIYSNWDGIKAVVTQAWDGIKEYWAAVWAPIQSVLATIWGGIASAAGIVFAPVIAFYSTIWDAVGPYFKRAWDAIAGNLIATWNDIKSIAASVWSGITGAMSTFLQWAAKIPGANKLMNLDDAWASAKKATAELDKTSKATEGIKKAATAYAGSSSKPGPKLTSSIAKITDTAKDATKAMKPLIDKHTELTETARILTERHDKAEKAVAELKDKLALMGDKMPSVTAASDDLNASIQTMISKIDVSKATIPGFTTLMDGMQDSSTDLGAAFEKLGVKSATEYQKVADEAKKAYDVINGSGIATGWEKNNAMLKMMEAQKAAMIANGVAIPAEFQAMLDKLNAQVLDPVKGLPKAKSEFGKFGTEVSTVITNFSQDIVKSLFEGDGSFADKGLKALKGLGEAVVAKFTEPFTKAATDLIGGVISDLLGGKGFGGILDTIKNIGKGITDVFGGGGGSAVGGVVGAAGSTGATAGGGGGLGGAASGGLSGVMGWANVITGGISAFSGILGNFQNARQENTLNAIEESTRYSKIYLGGQGQSIIWCAQTIAAAMVWVNGSLDDIRQKMTDWLSPLNDNAALVAERAYWSMLRLDQIGADVRYGADATRESAAILADIREAVRASSNAVINFTISGSASPQATAAAISQQLSLQGVKL